MEQGGQLAAAGGWPLGLHPMNAAAERLSTASATSSFLVYTPSLTSSSSDLDTESTGSFFPEKSTTLGSLIGIQSSAQLAFMEGDTTSTEGDSTRKRSRGHNRSCCTCWSLLACGGSVRNETLDFSPSLAHFLSRERKESLSQEQDSLNGLEESHVGLEQRIGQEHREDEEQQRQEAFRFDGFVSQGSALHNSAGASTSRPYGPTLRFILQNPSPTSYLSTDWNVFSDLSQNPPIKEHSSSGHGRFHTFWAERCCRLSTSLSSRNKRFGHDKQMHGHIQKAN